MRTVLLGDSHLARVRRDLHMIAPGRVLNAAVGGATSRDLEAQAHEADIRPSDDVVVSIGTNDAAPWKQVPLTEYEQRLRELLDNLWPDRTVLVTTPGVDESRLSGPGGRTNMVLATYAATAATVFSEAGATVLDAATVVSPLETAAFADDGVHLSGEGYRRLLPAIRWACESPSWFDDSLVTVPGGSAPGIVLDQKAHQPDQTGLSAALACPARGPQSTRPVDQSPSSGPP